MILQPKAVGSDGTKTPSSQIGGACHRGWIDSAWKEDGRRVPPDELPPCILLRKLRVSLSRALSHLVTVKRN